MSVVKEALKEAGKGVVRGGSRLVQGVAKGAIVRSAITGEPVTGAAVTWVAGKAVEKIASRKRK